MDVRVFGTPVPSETWSRETIPLPLDNDGVGPRRAWRVAHNLLRLHRLLDDDSAVVFSDDNPLTASLYALGRRGRQRPTIVRTDPLVTTPRSRWKRRFLRACLGAADRIVVWAPAVARRYRRALGVLLERMVPVRFHHTLAGFAPVPPAQRDYVFSGGDSMRDYATLLEAVRGLPVRVRIATRRPPPEGVAVPDNVTLAPASPAEFRALLAGARLVVMPLETDCLRTSGQQSYLNAMALGKPVIVTDPDDASYYIEDGRTGRLVPPRDPAALRAAVAALLDSPAEARAMGERARAFALPLDQEHTWSRVLEIARETHWARRAGAWAEWGSISMAAP